MYLNVLKVASQITHSPNTMDSPPSCSTFGALETRPVNLAAKRKYFIFLFADILIKFHYIESVLVF